MIDRRFSSALLGVAMIAGWPAVAFAADVAAAPVYKAVPAAALPHNWTGFYVGAHVGYGWGKKTWTNPGVLLTDYDMHSFLGGGQAGLDYQIGAVVVGLEGSFSGMNVKGSGFDVWGDSLEAKVSWIASLSGRLGFAWDRALIYGKGGVAWTEDQFSILTPAGRATETKQARNGWTWGLGLEYALAGNWSAKFEYDHINFGTHHVTFATGDFADIEQTVQIAKIGLNYRFH
jgi:outer membrane immunogenic protein